MAFDILSVPAMSDEPERIFSGARRTITWDKAQMEPNTIEMRECLKHWKKSKNLNQIVIEDWNHTSLDIITNTGLYQFFWH
jgi:hypothetical protein